MGKSYKLWDHQAEGVARALSQDTFALLFDVGTGKSATAIRSWCDRANIEKKYFRTLIFCPPVVCINWRREFALFSDLEHRRIHVLQGTGKDRLYNMKHSRASIFITNYESLLMPDLFAEMKKFAPEFMIFDESHKLKNPQASRSKKAAELADLAKYKLILTGTPILNTLMDLYMQFRVLDGGLTFGKNFFHFRAKYFYDKNAGMPKHMHFPDWQLKPRAMDEFNKIIHARGMVAKKADCLTLPPLVRQRIEVGMSAKQKRAYDSMAKDFIAFMEEGTAVATLAITKALRLQQIVSGFVRLDDDETKDVVFEDNPRIEALRTVLESILEQGEKAIIWATFHQNYEDIRQLLARMKVKYVELHGQVTEKQRQGNIDGFQNDDSVKVLVGHPGSGGVGVTLTKASYCIYYSRGFSLEFDLQSEARNYRHGSEQHQKITRIDLVAPGTIDDMILERLANKQTVSDRVLREIVEEMKSGK